MQRTGRTLPPGELARAWDIVNKLKPPRTSKMPRAPKVGVLTAVELVLMYIIIWEYIYSESLT